jgi:hypothetical protein
VGGDLLAGLGEVEEDDVTELALGVVGDADDECSSERGVGKEMANGRRLPRPRGRIKQ